MTTPKKWGGRREKAGRKRNGKFNHTVRVTEKNWPKVKAFVDSLEGKK